MRMFNAILNCVWAVFSAILMKVFEVFYKRRHVQLPPITNPILVESATNLAKKIRSKEVSSVEVVEAFISRINEVNPILNCVVQQRFKEALQEANKVDEYLKSTQLSQTDLYIQKPLLGVPFTIKDSFYVKGLKNTCGLYLWRNDVSDKDSDVVMLLKKAGAIPLGLTNVPELCTWYESYNGIYGRTNNPYHTGCIPGGSSGGEGALQASCGSAFGIGSDFGGSIRMPAFFNGIFGHKPSACAVSNMGQRPDRAEIFEAMNTVGPLCRYSQDVLTVLRVIAEKGKRNLHLGTRVDIKDLRYFYMTGVGNTPHVTPTSNDVKQCMLKVIEYLDNEYKIETKKVWIEEMNMFSEIFGASMSTDGHVPFTKLLTGGQGDINPWFEFMHWMLGKNEHTLPGLRFAISEKSGIKQGTPLHDKLIIMKKLLSKKFEDMLGTDGVFLFPTHPITGIYHHQPLVLPYNFAYTGIFNALGLPSTHCPIGFNSNGMPVGLQVVAGLNQDHLCLAVASELEKQFGGWVSPSPLHI